MYYPFFITVKAKVSKVILIIFICKFTSYYTETFIVAGTGGSVQVRWNQTGLLRFERGEQVNLTCTLNGVGALMLALVTKVARGSPSDDLEVSYETGHHK